MDVALGKVSVVSLGQLPHGDKVVCDGGHVEGWKVHTGSAQSDFKVSGLCRFCFSPVAVWRFVA